MSVFVRLNKQDAYVTSYTAHKSWTVSDNDFSSYGIQVYTALSSSGDVYINQAHLTADQQYSELVYRNLHHLYYSGFITGSSVSSSFENYNQTTLYSSASRQIYTTASLISIPKEVYGHAIKPGSFFLTANPEISQFVSASFVSGGFFAIQSTDGTSIFDDGEGVVRDLNNSNAKVGDIIYTHGHIVITDEALVAELSVQQDYTIGWQSSHTIYTHNYRCRVTDSSLNYSQNPSIKSGSNGYVYDFATGSYFQPYVTTVGLYNDANELVAVGKLAQPVPKSRYTDMTFVVNFDI